MTIGNVLHLRAEKKPMEHRAALTPSTTKALLDAGYKVHIEKSEQSIFSWKEYEAVGAQVEEEGSWQEISPSERIIIGLKELPEEPDFPVRHEMIHFQHCYKGQGGWEKSLAKFPRGGGTLYDLEFLQDESGRRVAAFGYHAGFAGAALAVKNFVHQQTHKEGQLLPGVDTFTKGNGFFENEDQMLEMLKNDLQEIEERPKIFVMGAKGRCGRGAVDLCNRIGLTEVVQWDIEETSKKSGPYTKEIVEGADIFINCIYLSSPIPPFLDMQTLRSPNRRVSVICDVSADTSNPHNPVKCYDITTTFDHPTVPVELGGSNGPTLSVISIDHLPSLLPREASEAFSSALLPSLMQLKDIRTARVWQEAKKLFDEKVATLPAEMQKKEA